MIISYMVNLNNKKYGYIVYDAALIILCAVLSFSIVYTLLVYSLFLKTEICYTCDQCIPIHCIVVNIVYMLLVHHSFPEIATETCNQYSNSNSRTINYSLIFFNHKLNYCK